MSFLLDALRKSEGRAQRGEVPTIHSGQALESADSGKRSRGPFVLMLLPAFLVLVWFGFRQYTGGEEPAAAPAVTAPAGTPAQMPVATGESGPLAETGAEPMNQESRDAFQEPVPGSVTGPRTPVEDFEMPPQSQAQAAVDELPDAVSGAAEGQPQSEMQGTPAARESETGREAVAEPYEAPRPGPISYWALPETIRRELPEFQISVLVYAERPEDRFLLLNGHRVLEGDEYQPGLVLEEIRRGGAIFSYRLYRFRITQ
jgi:hypothetical protein